LIRSSSLSCPLAFSVGMINATSLGLSERPPQPTGPALRQSCVVPALVALPTRSASLDDSHGLPSVTGYTAGLCPTTWSGLPPRPSPLWVNAPSLRAIIPTPGGEGVTPQYRHHPQRLSATAYGVSSPTAPTPVAVRGNLTTLHCSLHATARRVACPPVRVRPGDISGRRGRLRPSFPETGHPDLESDITTQPLWGETVAGLAPAGALLLWAAYSVG
jgi:hypothetical protein